MEYNKIIQKHNSVGKSVWALNFSELRGHSAERIVTRKVVGACRWGLMYGHELRTLCYIYYRGVVENSITLQ